MRLKESINQNQINLLKATYGDIKKINPNSAAVKKLMMVLKKLSKDDLETISKAKINFVSTMAQSILRDSNSSMKYVKEDIQPTNEADVNWNAVQNAIINFLKMNTKILDKKVQAKDTEGVKGGLKSIISGLTNAQRSLKLESVNEAASRTAMEIGGLTGLNKDAVQKFVDTHNMDIEAVYQYIKKSKLNDRLNFVTAVVGNPGNKYQKMIITKFGLKESINEVDAMLNKKVYKLLMKELGDLRTGGPNHQFAVMHILIGALRDANFHSDAKKVPALFPRAEYEGDPMGKEDTIDIYEYELGPKIANMAQWDGGAIADAIAFYTSMTIGRPLGQKIEKLIESMSSKYDLKESIKESAKKSTFTKVARISNNGKLHIY